jgi:hypothetical protein
VSENETATVEEEPSDKPGAKTVWHIEQLMPDGAWHANGNPRTDPAEIVRIWDFRVSNDPDVKMKLVRVEVSPEDIETLREMVAQEENDTEEGAVHSG